MRVKVTNRYEGMPPSANVGDEIELDDNQFADLQRRGAVTRVTADNPQAANQQQTIRQDSPQATSGQEGRNVDATQRAANQRAEYDRVNAQTDAQARKDNPSDR